MTDEEKWKLAFECAKKGIDLEKFEIVYKEIVEMLKPIIDLSIKNKKILDKYDKEKQNEL